MARLHSVHASQKYYRLPEDSRQYYENELRSKIESMSVRGHVEVQSSDVDLTPSEQFILSSRIEPCSMDIRHCAWLEVRTLLQELVHFAQRYPRALHNIIYETMQPCQNLIQLFATYPSDTIAVYRAYLATSHPPEFTCEQDILSWITSDATRKLALLARSKIVSSMMCDIEFVALLEAVNGERVALFNF